MEKAPFFSQKTSQKDFQQRLYLWLAHVPFGKLVSYGQLADLAGFPGNARRVGRALSALPKNTKLPWFRVVRANGSLAQRSSDGAAKQREKLSKEGVFFPLSPKEWKEKRWNPAEKPLPKALWQKPSTHSTPSYEV